MGFVTTPLARPALASATASSIAAMTAGALAGSSRPGMAGFGRGRCSTGSASAKAALACSGASIRRIGAPDSRSASSMRKKTGPVPRSACHALTAISPPTPAGSPMVTASGAWLMLGM